VIPPTTGGFEPPLLLDPHAVTKSAAVIVTAKIENVTNFSRFTKPFIIFPRSLFSIAVLAAESFRWVPQPVLNSK
jgi:hypothetical protein